MGSQTVRECVYLGAIQGVVAWTAYGVVECLFSSILPWAYHQDSSYQPLHWGFTVILFGLYAIFGLILGGLAGLGLRTVPGGTSFLNRVRADSLLRVVATVTVIVAFALNLVVQVSFGLSVMILLSISVLLVLGMGSSLRESYGTRRLSFLANPWTASMMLLGLSWITLDLLASDSRALKGAVVFIYLTVVFLFSLFAQKIVKARRIEKSTGAESGFQASPVGILTVLVLVVLGVSFFSEGAPYKVAWSKLLPIGGNHPNVVLITLDTIRADHLSLYGYERDTTPNLKKFSEEATVYSRAIAASDMTLSSHASIFTGLYPRSHGAHYDSPEYPGGRPLTDKFHTLAEILSENGYLTMGIVANNAYLHHTLGLDQGFQYYDERAGVPFLGQTSNFYLRQGIRNVLTHLVDHSLYDLEYRRAEEISSEAIQLLNKAKESSRPFFLFINYMDAHWPYIPPPPFDTQYPGKGVPINSERYYALYREVLKFERKVTEKEHRHLVSQYDGGIAYLDFHLGKLTARLKDLGLYEDSLIIITADHGEAFGERNLLEHGVSVYQDQVHIPLIIKYPKMRQKNRVDEAVSGIDILPTVLDALGLKRPKDIQGQSLMRLNLESNRIVISESYPAGDLPSWHPRFNRVERAVFSGPLKFISSTAGKRELYDLSKDPNETNDLYSADAGLAKELEQSLNEWLKAVVVESGSKATLDEGTLDRLRSLGYVQ